MALARRRIFDKARFGKTRLTRTGATTMPFGAWLGLGVAASALVTLLARARRADVQEAMEVMSDCQIGRLPVVDENNRVIGILTLSSLALRVRKEDEALQTAKEVSRRAARA